MKKKKLFENTIVQTEDCRKIEMRHERLQQLLGHVIGICMQNIVSKYELIIDVIRCNLILTYIQWVTAVLCMLPNMSFGALLAFIAVALPYYTTVNNASGIYMDDEMSSWFGKILRQKKNKADIWAIQEHSIRELSSKIKGPNHIISRILF